MIRLPLGTLPFGKRRMEWTLRRGKAVKIRRGRAAVTGMATP